MANISNNDSDTLIFGTDEDDTIRNGAGWVSGYLRKGGSSVTISGGVAEFSTEINSTLSPEELVDVADKALYVSKNKGRNRITFAFPALMAALDSEQPGSNQ